jgi:hypothetical protein
VDFRIHRLGIACQDKVLYANLMVTLYKINRYDRTVESEEFERVTEKFAFRKQRTWRGIQDVRTALRSDYRRYYQTREEAVNDLRTRLTSAIESNKRELELDTLALARLA